MGAKVVIGTQWGDEGKGKVIDILSAGADVVVRATGGNNAGHTVVNGEEVYKLHLLPSGILYPETLCLIGCGVVVDPAVLISEINTMQSRGITCDNLRIDPRAHIIMPWHVKLDALAERERGDNDIGTTGCGIGPCYMDKSERSGLRICDLIVPERFAEKARAVGERKNEIIVKLYGEKPLDIDAIIGVYTDYGKRLAQYAADVSVLTYNAIKEGKKVLFEGAQATLLDIDMGTYPYVTSSNPISGGFTTGIGIGPNAISEVIGVCKAYTTRVGKGPFPTELFDKTGDYIRNRGNEFGTTTGRPRRTGWFDAVILRYAVRVNGLTGIAMNKLDTLANMGSLKVCVAYKLPDGSIIEDFPTSLEDLALCEPVYEELEGYSGNLGGCRSYDELPDAAKRYIQRIEELVECPIKMIGVGPGRDQVITK